jgi:hypothetical protein
MERFRHILGACASLTIAASLLADPVVTQAADSGDDSQQVAAACRLAPGLKHVVQIQFDNVHLRRDNPNVPSDLEQMPNLLQFLETQGVLLINHHTPLISHTADDIITTLTGTYGDRHGQPVANGYGYFRANGTVGFSSSFAYWTDTAPDEVDVDVRQLLLTEFNDTTPFAVHSDDAPTVYVFGNPGPTDPLTRSLEHHLARLLAFDPIKGGNVALMQRMADPVEMSFLHMVTRDPARTPTLTYFGNDDFFIVAGKNPATCAPLSACSDEQPGFNWSHGDFQQSITRTWLGLVGPQVRQAGATGEVFSDHTDVRPTLVYLTGLRDDYSHDGRVLVEVLASATPQRDTFTQLASAYKAINAPVAELGRKTLELSTRALVSDDATYATLEEQLTNITAQRNALAARMIAILESAAFDHARINEDEARDLIQAADTLIESVP